MGFLEGFSGISLRRFPGQRWSEAPERRKGKREERVITPGRADRGNVGDKCGHVVHVVGRKT